MRRGSRFARSISRSTPPCCGLERSWPSCRRSFWHSSRGFLPPMRRTVSVLRPDGSRSPGRNSPTGWGLPLAGRDFTDADRSDADRVVIVSETLARQLLPNQEALNRHLRWTDGVMKFIGVSTEPRRIVGIVPDVDDENVDPVPTMTIYHPAEQEAGFGRLFVHARTDPYALVAPITQVVRALAAEQPVERASTLEDVRAEVLAPTRLNAIVFGGFSAVALAIAAVGVAGVLAFSVSGRTREFGIRLAVGSQPRHLLAGGIAEGAGMAGGGTGARAGGGGGRGRGGGRRFSRS